MAIWFVGRHPGAQEWIQEKGFKIDHTVPHLSLSDIQTGDIILGTLPIHLAAQVCEKQAEYWHLSVDLLPEQRGKELSAQELDKSNARLERYLIQKQ